jgi:hypothetical protein
MFAAFLLAISTVALLQFALFYWRAILSGVAAQPVSARVLDSAGVAGGQLTARDFAVLVELHGLTAALDPSIGGLKLVRAYHQAIRALDALFGRLFPEVGFWSERECATCARYAAVQIDRRLQANLSLAASLRSC